MSSRYRKEPGVNRSRQCPSHEEVYLIILRNRLLKNNRCERHRNEEIRVCGVCQLRMCERCVDEYLAKKNEKFESEVEQSKSNCLLSVILLGVLVLALLVGVTCYKQLSWGISVQVLTPNDNLRSYFPSQRTETWQNIFSVLDMEFPTVKSLTLLHSENDKTTECLVSKLITVYTNDNNIRIENISFENFSQEVKDYGEVLEYYRSIVEKHRIFVTDLNKIPGNIARIFHSLCDEGSSPIKPSLFIFILRYDENSKHLKPLIRATTILKEVWQDLPSNELFPLLSRVVKNVIDVIPEKQIKC